MREIKLNSQIAVGLSGGVDSAVAAALLKQRGHEVVGVHMRRTDVGMPGCGAETDLADARRVAEHIGISFLVWDFRDEYQKRVIGRFVEEYQRGRTPNPDIWCNEEIKFGLFLNKAVKKLDVDYIATGHYARIEAGSSKIETGEDVRSSRLDYSNSQLPVSTPASSLKRLAPFYYLLKGVDHTKDQSYFLYRLTQEQLSRAVFPLGGYMKEQVRKLAQQLLLPNANKPDSVGICFIGEIDVKEFLKDKIKFEPGEVANTSGEVIGSHDGVWFYTLGQRHGFEVTRYQGKPLYVVDKDVENNLLVVGRDEESDVTSFTVEDLHWVGGWPKFAAPLLVRIRHLGELIPCTFEVSESLGIGTCKLKIPTRGIAPGQHAVFYQGDEVLGGGVIDSFVGPKS